MTDRPDYGVATAGARAAVLRVQEMFAAFAHRDLDALLPQLDPGCTLDVPETARRAGREGLYRGYDGIREYFADVERLWSGLQLEPQDFRATGDSVVVFGRVTGHIDGAEIDQPVMWTWKLAGGQIVSGRVFNTPSP